MSAGPQGLFDSPVEKVAENILEDLFTMVLDWSLDDVNLQVGRADVVLSELGIKRLVLEVKRPGTLRPTDAPVPPATARRSSRRGHRGGHGPSRGVGLPPSGGTPIAIDQVPMNLHETRADSVRRRCRSSRTRPSDLSTVLHYPTVVPRS